MFLWFFFSWSAHILRLLEHTELINFSQTQTTHSRTTQHSPTPQWIKHLSQDITISFLCRRKANVWSFRRHFSKTSNPASTERCHCATMKRFVEQDGVQNYCLLKIWWPVHFGEDPAISLSLFPGNLCSLFSLAVFSSLWFMHIEALRASVWCQLTKKTEMKNISQSEIPSIQSVFKFTFHTNPRTFLHLK